MKAKHLRSKKKLELCLYHNFLQGYTPLKFIHAHVSQLNLYIISNNLNIRAFMKLLMITAMQAQQQHHNLLEN